MENKNKNQEPALKALAQLQLEKLQERFTSEKVEKWKKEFAPRQLNVIEVEDKIAVLRPISAMEVSTYTQMYIIEGMDKACSFILNELRLDGDSEMRDVEDYFISAMMQVEGVINLKKSTFYKI
jgi:hypothetical protein